MLCQLSYDRLASIGNAAKDARLQSAALCGKLGPEVQWPDTNQRPAAEGARL